MLGSGSTAAIAEVLRDPLSLIAERSPGARADGSLLAAKRGKGVKPVELVMSTSRERAPSVSEAPAPASVPDSLAIPAEPLVTAGVPVDAAPGDAILGPPQELPPGVGNPGFLVPIGSVPGDSGTPGCCTPPPDTVPAVPEPETWVMLILGFFMVGAALRATPKHGVGRRTS